MSNLTFAEKNKLEKLFEMRTGYVLDFTDRKFREFVRDSTGKDIATETYKSSGASKANRLRAFWAKEQNSLVGKLIGDLLQLIEDENPETTTENLYQECLRIAQRLGSKDSAKRVIDQKRINKSKRTSLKGTSVRSPNDDNTAQTNPNAQVVFVIHGRNNQMREAMFRFLRSIGLRPVEWSHAVELTGKPSPYVGEILDAGFSEAQALLVLMTPDDEARLIEPYRSLDDPKYESELKGQPRPNVLFEAGMAMGRHPERTVLVEVGKVRPFSDIAGRHIVRLDNSTEARQKLAQRLIKAGCAADLSGTDWHREGDFKLVVPTIVAQANVQSKDVAIQKRVREALNHPRFKWRSIEQVAVAAGISKKVASNLLRADDEVRFSKSKTGNTIVGLRSRVD
jgi:predicted nucleotide-binding protein